MATETAFGNIIEFFAKIGIYDVVLPFLLVFTIVFAILEKTKIFGTEKVKISDKEYEYTKKNLNAMVAFVTGFLVVASTRLVAVLNNAVANVALMLIVLVCFLMLIGSFYGSKDEVMLEKGPWRTTFMVVTALGVVLIFMNSLGWLFPFINYIGRYWQTNFVGSVILIILIVVFMGWVTKSPGHEEEKKDKKKD